MMVGKAFNKHFDHLVVMGYSQNQYLLIFFSHNMKGQLLGNIYSMKINNFPGKIICWNWAIPFIFERISRVEEAYR
jgi:hypothetical protein